MSLKKIRLSFVLLAIMQCCMAFLLPASREYTVKWQILEQCMVKVNGTTNVNNFACTVAGLTNADTLICLVNKNNDGTVFMNGNMAVPVVSFDCVNKMMTKDLRKTLREKDYPNFYIHFISMETYPLLRAAQQSLNGLVDIELAGVKKQLAVHYRISMNDNGIIELTGTQVIHFSDFNMVAPRKMAGMIKTNDKLNVEFTIHCRIVR